MVLPEPNPHEPKVIKTVVKVCCGKQIKPSDLPSIERELRFLAITDPLVRKVTQYKDRAFKRFVTLISVAMQRWLVEERTSDTGRPPGKDSIEKKLVGGLNEVSKGADDMRVVPTSSEPRPTLQTSKPETNYDPKAEVDRSEWKSCVLTVHAPKVNHEQVIFYIKKFTKEHHSDVHFEVHEILEEPPAVDFLITYRKSPVDTWLFANNCHNAVTEAWIKPVEDFGRK